MFHKIFFLLSIFFSFKIFPQYDAFNELKKIPFVDFKISMGIKPKKLEEIKKNQEALKRFQFFSSIYEKNNFLKIIPSDTPRIPQIIHQIWLGKKQHLGARISKKWIEMHPNWKYKLWNDNNIHELFPLYNQKYFDESKNLGEKSDILRYEILYRFGGFYIDIDYECIKNFDVLTYCYDFVAGLEPIEISYVYAGNAIIGSCANHLILKECIDKIKDFRSLSGVAQRTGPAHLTRAILKVGDLKNVIIMPMSYLYPWNPSYKFKYSYTFKESLGFHYWFGSWK